MSELSVNDHLEGILSDFEALKRSFDIDDEEDLTFTSPNAVCSLTAPTSPHFYLNHSRPTVHPSSHMCSPSDGSPAVRPRAVVTSLSFTKGTTAKPAPNNASSYVTRATSFHSRFRLNGYSTVFGEGSDNDSLHSSTSSLEFSVGGPKLLSSPCSPEEHLPSPQQNLDTNINQRKVWPVLEPGDNLKSPRDPYVPNGHMKGTMNRGIKMANANWNIHLRNPALFGEELHQVVNDHSYNVSSATRRKPPLLGKFPLDLDEICTQPPQTTLCSAGSSRSSLDSSNVPVLVLQHVLHVGPSPVPLSQAQTLHLDRGQQDGASAPDADELTDSVGSILQRIASFSRTSPHTDTDGTPPAWNLGHDEDSAAELEQDIPMEDTEALPAPHTPMTNSSFTVGQDDQDCGGVLYANGILQDDGTERAQPEDGDPALDSIRENGTPPADCRVHLESRVHTEDPTMRYLCGADLFGYVGIEAVLDQMRKKTMKAGFEFNVMVVGQSGLGKSTLVNTLFKSRVSRKSCSGVHQEKIPKTVLIHQVSHMIEEKGVKMKLTVVDTPGFGDHINNSNCWEPIVSYVNEQYERYLREELNVTRQRRIPDSRVHCCVYFLPPTGHRLRPIDVEFMKRLGNIVSIVPVIAKADTLTLDERLDFKQRIRQDLAAHGIQVYPQKQHDEDPEEHHLNASIRESIPFAVVGTDREHQVNGNKVLGRKTKWGIIEVENIAHCEFALLRDLLIRSHLQDLKDVTHSVLYETYRVRRLNQANVDFSRLDLTPDFPLLHCCEPALTMPHCH